MPTPLEGITILDFTRFQNGPHATVMLSDMGAEIIKVELPGEGDPGRALGRRADDFCSYFEACDRGKRSITVNLSTPQGKEIIRKLVERVDVVTENFRPGVMDRLELGYEDLRGINPQLIYAVNSGFGPQGKWASVGSFDIVAQGMSGAMISAGGGPGSEPRHLGWGLADQVGSMVFAYGITMALLARERHGVGQKLDVSQLGAMTTLQALSIVSYLHMEQQGRSPGGRGAVLPTFSSFQAQGGEWLTLGVLTPRHWPGLCAALQRDDLLNDERSADPFARAENRDWLMDQISATIATKPSRHWLDALIANDVPCGPVYDYAQVSKEPQFWDNGYLTDLEHPHFDGHRTVGIPLTMSETPGRVQGPAPELGQHTEEVLLDLGYSWPDIEKLHEVNAI